MKNKINHVKKYFSQVETIARIINKKEIDILVEEILRVKKNSGRIFFLGVKISKILGFKAKRSLEEAVRDLCASFKKGLILKSFENDLYYNVRRLKNIQAK